jgi:predicted ATPase
MIKTLTFTEPWRCFKQDDAIVFHTGINLLVGEQGMGKSSLLQAIAAACKSEKYQFEHGLAKKIKVTATACPCGGFDFEKNNLRTLSYFEDGCTAAQISLSRMSHGQANNLMLSGLKGARDTLLFFDEPDMSLSIKSITTLAALLWDAMGRGCQVIASVHHPFLIQAFPECFDMEAREWVSSDLYVQSQLE